MTNSHQSLQASTSARGWEAIGMLLLLAVMVGLCWRLWTIMILPGQPAESAERGLNGLADFRDVVYYPQLAVRAGVNPYDTSRPPPPALPRYQQRYPVGNFFPLYSPLILVLYWPLGWFDFNTSAAIYVLINLLLAAGWIALLLRGAGAEPRWGNMAWWGCLYFITQAGRSNFLGGETALPLTLASYGAIRLSDQRPVLAGLLLALTSIKPTFGLPLGMVLLAAGRWRTVLIGWGLGFVIGVAGLWIIFQQSGDLFRFREILLSNHQALEADVDVNPHTSGVRIDAVAAIETWLPPSVGTELLASAMVMGLAVAGVVRHRWREAQSEIDQLPTNEIIMAISALAVVAGMYHLLYDGLLIYAVLAWLIFSPNQSWRTQAKWLRPALIGLVAFPLVNLFTTQVMQNIYVRCGLTAPPYPLWITRFAWTCICSANGFALLLAMLLLAWLPKRRSVEIAPSVEIN